ncbi:unnamed protein product [Symbiodinium natans]|uniref:Uncharacterized protein n=1 Tax=Symbiodinium natans TaxID=878477 RepID=A0A812RBZ0_9DINO|nr:unnamed protein product [Symbiodinium natans]
MSDAIRSTLALYKLLSSDKFSRPKAFCKGLGICSSSGNDKEKCLTGILTDIRIAMHHLHRTKCLWEDNVMGHFASRRVRFFALRSSLRMSRMHLLRAAQQIQDFCPTGNCLQSLRKRPKQLCAKACASLGLLQGTLNLKADILSIVPDQDIRGLDDMVHLVSSFVGLET